jgi:hypothetical protein
MLRNSDPDNQSFNSNDPVVDKISSSFIEYQIFSLMRIDIISLINIKASLSKAFHIQPSEIDNMPMWEFELYIKQLNELVKEENDGQKKEMDKYRINDYMKMASPSNMNKTMANASNPSKLMGNMKMPSMGSIGKGIL